MTHAESRERNKRIAEFCIHHSASEACKRFQVAPHIVYSACRSYDVQPPKARTGIPTSAFNILKMRLDGYSAIEIALEMNITKQRVHQVLTKAREAGFKC